MTSFLRIGDVVLHSRFAGRALGPALVFSNSLGTDHRIWDEVVGLLGERYRILLYDKRGHGLSEAPAAPYAMDQHADDLIGLLDHFGIARVAVVGLSVGGMIAQRVAVRVPERVAALALCDTAAKIGSAEMWNQRIAALEAGGLESIADAVLGRWFTAHYQETRPDAMAGWRAMLTRQTLQGYAGTCAAIRDCDLTADAPAISVPTLALAGEADLSTPPDLVRATAALIPGARFELIRRSGHLPCIEQPEALADALARHFEEAGHV